MSAPRIESTAVPYVPGIGMFSRDPELGLQQVLDKIKALPTTAMRLRAVDALPSYVIAAWQARGSYPTLAAARESLRNRIAIQPGTSSFITAEAALWIERMEAFMRRENHPSLTFEGSSGAVVTLALRPGT